MSSHQKFRQLFEFLKLHLDFFSELHEFHNPT